MLRSRVKFAGLALVAVLLLSGCLQSRTVINVNSDGSGTLEETFLMRQDIAQMMASMGDEQSFSLLDRDELERAASDYGRGVTFESAEEMSTDWGTGYVVVYAFEDINDLRVNQNPSDDMPAAAGETEGAVEYIQFAMTPGNPATLEIMLPEPEEGDAASGGSGSMPETGEAPEISSEQMQGMASAYTDMRISVDVAVNGTIVDTNATHREENRVTLIDMDFNKILEDPAVMQQLARQEPGSLSAVETMVTDIPGVAVETKRSVQVRFR